MHVLDPSTCYRALQTRDARFDGRFFTAVRSTRIYCRPVCPARTPRRENCLFLPSAAAAETAGYRPCLRCRPEAAPGTPAWQGTSATVARGLRLISEGALDGASVADLARRLGVGERHLRRLFLAHLGATPLAVAQTRRLLFARKLIGETRLPMTRVAEAAGFSSLRRFNDAFRTRYGCAPRELRSRRSRPADAEARAGLSLTLPYRPPYAWEALRVFLHARATPGVEAVHGDCYARTFRLDGCTGWLEVEPVPGRHALRARLHGADPAVLLRAAHRLRAAFDLDADPAAIAAHLGRDRSLRDALHALPGVRVPGAFDGFELAVRTILGQQVSVSGATTLAGRVAEAFGECLPESLAAPPSVGLARVFPTPEALAEADLARAGLTAVRAGAIRALATEVARGALELAPAADPEQTRARLSALPGIGPWTAGAIAMRALGHTDAYPVGDLGLRRALGLSGAALEQAAERWRPWRAYAAMLLWQGPTASPRARRGPTPTREAALPG